MDSTIIALLIGSSTALIGLCLKLSYSSHCTHVKCCCLEVDRDTATEQLINIGNSTPRQNNMV